MDSKTGGDLTILGTGSAGGGTYHNVTIKGVGTVDGDLEAVDFHCQGVASIHGKISARTLHVQGEASINGPLKTTHAHLSGQASVHGEIETKSLRVEGLTNIHGGLAAEDVYLRGAVEVQGDCKAETFTGKGTFRVGGLLNAGSLEVALYGPSHAREIGGEHIVIRKSEFFGLRRFLRSIFPAAPFVGRLTADIIEGDEVRLESTKARIVRGNDVIIGPECEIDLVEYRNRFERTSDTSVREQRKV